MEITPDQLRLMRLFFPYAYERHTDVSSNNIRFVHYTRADAALNILRSREVWMRKSSCMNDFMEVEHGLGCLATAYKSDDGQRFKSTLDRIFPGVSSEIEELFNGWAPHLRNNTFFSCFSEHKISEDFIGRLSMWRAYGAGTGVAIVMTNGPFLRPSRALAAYTSPVAYLRDRDVAEQLGNIATAVAADADFVRARSREEIKGRVFDLFRFGAACNKHPGFAEEREWRVVYCPTFEKSDRLRRDIHSFDGVPQPIYKIPLQDVPDEGLTGIEIPTLVERIIVGPTQYPVALCEAFIQLLGEAGVVDSEQRVFLSNIPLRR